MSEELERRCITVDLRAGVEGESRTLEGYAVVFGSLSEDLGGFREVIEPGAFSAALSESPDVRALFNHDANLVLGRTVNGTLRLTEDAHGLRMAVALPVTSYANDVHALVQRGDVNQMSFAFRARKGGESWATEKDGQRVRRLRSLSLYDVSVVTYPAYQATTVAARTLEAARETAQADESDGQEAGEIEAQETQRALRLRAQAEVELINW